MAAQIKAVPKRIAILPNEPGKSGPTFIPDLIRGCAPEVKLHLVRIAGEARARVKSRLRCGHP